MESTRRRLWRLRKLHHYVDADVRSVEGGVELRFLYDGESTYTRRWGSQGEAAAEAAARRAELERDGWMFHW